MKALLAVSSALIVAGATAWHGGQVENDEHTPRSSIFEWVREGDAGARDHRAPSPTKSSDRLALRVADVKAQQALGMLAVATGFAVAGVAWTRRR